MKIQFAILVLTAGLVIGSTSCSKKTSGKIAQGKEDATEMAKDTLPEMPEEAAARLVSDTLLFFQKTACFGKCPTYDVLVLASGEVTFKGIDNVDRKGVHKAKLDIRQIAGLLKEASKCNFFSLEEHYPVDDALFIPDLPNTITYFKQGDLKKKVFNNNEAPEALLEFENYLTTLFNSLEYKEVTVQK